MLFAAREPPLMGGFLQIMKIDVQKL